MARQHTVLVVDDEVGARESLRAILASEYQILLATNGEQALHLVGQQAVDVVLLDLRMPGLGAMQVLEAIKGVDPTIEVIIVTAYASSAETLRQGAGWQVFAHITKPFPVAQLRETVKQALAHRS